MEAPILPEISTWVHMGSFSMHEYDDTKTTRETIKKFIENKPNYLLKIDKERNKLYLYRYVTKLKRKNTKASK